MFGNGRTFVLRGGVLLLSTALTREVSVVKFAGCML
jgi:hypothetical protein